MHKLFEIPSITLFLCVFCAFLWLKNPRNLRNPWLINDLRIYKILYCCRETITDVMIALQIDPFFAKQSQFQKSQMNVSNHSIREYEQMDTWSIRKNEPKTNPNEPNLSRRSLWRSRIKPNSCPHQCGGPISEMLKMNVNKVLTKDYENKSHFAAKAKQTQSCPSSVWRDKPNLSRRSLWRSRIKSNPQDSKPRRFDCCLALDLSALSTIGLMNSISKHLVLRMIKSFLNIFGPPCVIVRKTGLIVRKEALSISRAKMGNRILFHIDKMGLEMYDNMIEFCCGMPFLKGAAMDSPKDRPSWEFSWRIIIVYVGLMVLILALIVVTFMTDIFRTSEEGQIPPIVWLLLAGVFIIAIIATLSNVIKIFDAIQDNNAKLEIITETLKKNQSELAEISRSTHLSEAVKAIVFRDADRQSIREAVLDRLQKQDFDTAHAIIDEIAHRAGYKELAENLRTEVDKHLGATRAERIDGAIAHIKMLLVNYEWARASAQIERLIKAYPDSGEAKAMRQTLVDKKEERKRVLLNAWDDAVKRRATDRSLEILKELDLYLTPEEGLALQEAARDVFKDKLHNLGVQFSLAVSGEQWGKAIQVGQEIIRDFPNSRMSEEIRERMDVLKQKVELQSR
jgi:hypothetical protein